MARGTRRARCPGRRLPGLRGRQRRPARRRASGQDVSRSAPNAVIVAAAPPASARQFTRIRVRAGTRADKVARTSRQDCSRSVPVPEVWRGASTMSMRAPRVRARLRRCASVVSTRSGAASWSRPADSSRANWSRTSPVTGLAAAMCSSAGPSVSRSTATRRSSSRARSSAIAVASRASVSSAAAAAARPYASSNDRRTRCPAMAVANRTGTGPGRHSQSGRPRT